MPRASRSKRTPKKRTSGGVSRAKRSVEPAPILKPSATKSRGKRSKRVSWSSNLTETSNDIPTQTKRHLKYPEDNFWFHLARTKGKITIDDILPISARSTPEGSAIKTNIRTSVRHWNANQPKTDAQRNDLQTWLTRLYPKDGVHMAFLERDAVTGELAYPIMSRIGVSGAATTVPLLPDWYGVNAALRKAEQVGNAHIVEIAQTILNALDDPGVAATIMIK